jgi:hypothetical protein
LPGSDIIFGTGSSSLFAERMRIYTFGGDGLNINGRIILKNGTNPVNLNYGPGVWMYTADNSALLGFMGVQNNQNLGFYGGPGGWGFTYDAINSRVGIGNNNPNAPLSFGATLGKKITLYPGTLGDAGLGMAGNRLQIYADNPNADVAIGYDAAGSFVERFAFKPTGAMALNGNQGIAGQVITSTGSGAVAWQNPMAALFNNTVKKQSQTSLQIVQNARDDVPDLTHTFTVPGNAFVLVNYNYFCITLPCTFCGPSSLTTEVFLDGVVSGNFLSNVDNGQLENISGSMMIPVSAGTHTIKIGCKNGGPSIRIGKQFSDSNSEASFIVITQ